MGRFHVRGQGDISWGDQEYVGTIGDISGVGGFIFIFHEMV